MNDKSKISLVFFIIIVLGLALGGFYLISNKKSDTNDKTKEKYDIKKIVKDKELVYYEDEDILDNDIPILFKKPVINLDSNDAKEINNKLSSNLSTLKNTKKLISENEVDEDKILYTNADIYSISQEDYESYNYDKYLSFVVYDYLYTCMGPIDAKYPCGYVFDVTTGSILSKDELFKKAEISENDFKQELREFLVASNDRYALQGEEMLDFINIEETLNNLEYNKTYTLYINNDGKIVAYFVVNTKEVNYNDNIILN